MNRAKIAGIGYSVPDRIVTNSELEKYMDTSDEWIQSRSGIKERRWVEPGTGTSDLGIDASKKTISVAKKHAQESKLKIDYQCITLNEYIKKTRKKFDCVICYELIEHVPDPQKLLEDINIISKNNSTLFLSTINRNIQSFIFAKILAEYFLKIIPKGTHKYEKFVKPSELTETLEGLSYNIEEITGMIFNPLIFDFELSSFTNINYFLYAKKNKK